VLHFAKVLVIFSLLFGFTSSRAQTVFSSVGKDTLLPQFHISHTLGEPLIQSLNGSSILMTQGFHQPDLILTVLEPGTGLEELEVFPNPVSKELFVKNGEGYSYRLFGLGGELVKEGLISRELESLNLKDLAAAPYNFEITGKSSRRVYQIIKTDY
jgi:hypothetical protein